MKNFSITTEPSAEKTILKLSGRFSLGDGSTAIRDQFKDLVAKGVKDVVLDLTEAAKLDSSCFGEIVAGFTLLTNHGGTITETLVAPKSTPKTYLTISKLWNTLNTVDVSENPQRSGNPNAQSPAPPPLAAG